MWCQRMSVCVCVCESVRIKCMRESNLRIIVVSLVYPVCVCEFYCVCFCVSVVVCVCVCVRMCVCDPGWLCRLCSLCRSLERVMTWQWETHIPHSHTNIHTHTHIFAHTHFKFCPSKTGERGRKFCYDGVISLHYQCVSHIPTHTLTLHGELPS